MKRFAAVALREVAERRFVLVAAAAAAVLPFLAPLLPGVPAGDGPAVRSIVALTLACAFGLGGSLLVGASVVGRELAERRLSFHFARPLSGATIWGGKLAGGLALVLLAEALVVLPSSAVGGEFPGLPGLGFSAPILWALLLLAVPFFLFAWVGSVSLRSRSPWLVVDLILLFALPGLLFGMVRRLARYGHEPEPSWVIGAGAVVLAALLVATLAQVVAGRTDPRRGHGAQSLAFWGILLAATAASGVWAQRVIDPGLGSLVRAWATPAGSSGDVVFVRGSVRDGADGYLYVRDLATGAERVLPMNWESAASADGTRVAIVRGEPLSRSVEAVVIEVRSGRSVVVSLPEWPTGVALSADGGRFAAVAAGVCSVVELPSLRLLASARVPADPVWAYVPRFISADKVRLHPLRRSYRSSREMAGTARVVTDPQVADLHVQSKTVSPLGRYPMAAIPFRSVKPEHGLATEPYFKLQLSPDLSRVLVVAWGAARSVRFLEATTGTVLAAFDGPEGAGNPSAFFLADGRAVVAEWLPNGRRLVVLSPDGVRVSELALDSSTRHGVRLGFEPSPGLLAVGVNRDTTGTGARWFLADLAAGRVRPLAVEPLYRAWWHDSDFVPPPGSPATRLANDAGGRLVLYDPSTGATTLLTRGRPAAK